MPKRGTNIYKRKDGRWEARYVKFIDLNGKKKYGSVYASSYAEAREKQLLNIQNYKCIYNNNSGFTLKSIMAEWLSSIENNVKKTTFQKYSSIANNHIFSHKICSLPLRMITVKQYTEFAHTKLDSGFLSEKTVNDILVVIGLALSYAEEVYDIKKIKLPHIKEPKKEMRVLSVGEQKQLESYLYNQMDLYKFGILIALYTGIRVGELCALQWNDLREDYIVISKTMHRIKDGSKTVIEITEPKTESSNRIIPIPHFFIPFVNQYRSTGYVMKNRNDKPVEPRLMQMKFENIILGCGLPKTNFHALRHTFATRCIEAGFDIKSLSEILGHTDVKTTLNKYVHSSYEQKQKNMERLKPMVNI